jgi:hypothetical protein
MLNRTVMAGRDVGAKVKEQFRHTLVDLGFSDEMIAKMMAEPDARKVRRHFNGDRRRLRRAAHMGPRHA